VTAATKGNSVTHPLLPRPDPARRALARLGRAALVFLLTGCARDAGVLARVNGQPITVDDFTEIARGNLGQYPGPPDSAKARLLKDLVDRELLVQGAQSERLDETPEFQSYRGHLERQVLRETLFQRLFGGPFPVSEAEVEEFYARRATATRARLIFAYDEAVARQAARDLARGDSFPVVADRYNPTGMVPTGGDIGFVRAGTLLAPLDDMVRTGAVGRVFGPVAAGGEGWFLVRIEERRPQPRPPLEQVRAQLAEMLRQRKQRAHQARVRDRLRAEYQVEVQHGGPQAMVDKLRSTPGDGTGVRTPPPPGPQDRRLVLARYRGGTYTLGEAYDDLVAGSGGPLEFAMLPSVERWIEDQTLERAALAEAMRRRLADEPAVRARLRDRLNNHLLDAYYQHQVIARIRIGPEDSRAAYERFRDSFARLQRARVVSVTLADSAVAATLAAQAGQAPSLRDAAAAAAAGGRVAEEELTFPAEDPVWTRFEDHLTTMSAGGIAGPFRTEGGWLIFQLREKRQVAPPFDHLSPEARGQLQGLATELRRETRLQALTDSLRRAFAPIVVYQERLRRLPWPPPPARPAET
jgi:peptidyl-prolyl cis-trans isomerase C